MTCDRLVCAHCAGPVSEGRCPVCRAERQRLHHSTPFASLSPAAVLGLVLVLVAVALLVQNMAG